MAVDPVNWTPERRMRLLRHLWARTEGKGWEPPDPNHWIIGDLIAGGFIRRTDGRCGFERMRDACVTWTDAARLALGS